MSLFWLITGLLVLLLLFLLYVVFLVRLVRKEEFILFVVFLAIPYFCYKTFQYYWFTQILPAEIAVTYPLSMGEEYGLTEGCGVAVFKLSQSTIEAIEKERFGFLNRATQARGHDKSYYKFEQWQETPAPFNWVRNGTWGMCAQPYQRLNDEIIKAAKEPGSYYTTESEGQLLVIPSLGYAVLSYNG